KVDVEAAWKKFQAERIGPVNIKSTSEAKPSPGFKKYTYNSGKRRGKRRIYYAAAAIALHIVTVFVLQMQQKEAVFQKIVTAAGEKAQTILSDGTRVKLNAESVLKIPSDYGEKSRDVYLRGEAFFEVEHDDAKPFSVHIGGVIVKD